MASELVGAGQGSGCVMAVNTITSVQNPRVKDAIRLRSARHRTRQGRFLIDGARELLQALAGGIRFSELFLCAPLCRSSEAQEVLVRLDEFKTEVWHVSEPVFAKMAFGQRHDGVLGVAAAPRRQLADFEPAGNGPIAVLERMEKPGNVGAVLRSADGAGVGGVILAEPRTDLYNPNCIRASLGTVFTQIICTATVPETLDWLRSHSVRILATRPDAELSYTAAQLGTRAAIVLGSEACGLSPAWQGPDVTAIKLPMLGTADSLNISATAAVLFYEALRERERAAAY